MPVTTLEGIVDNGQIRLVTPVHLPDNTKVYVIIPDFEVRPVVHIYSPRLAHPEQVVDFKKEMIEPINAAPEI